MRRIIDAFAEYERLIIGARTKAAYGPRKSVANGWAGFPTGIS
jgi:site-specific DNA recombinase